MTNQVAAAARHPSRAQIGRVLWQNKTLILAALRTTDSGDIVLQQIWIIKIA